MDIGFDRTDISVVAGCGAIEHEFGTMPNDISHLVGEPDVPRAAHVEHAALVQAKAAIAAAVGAACLGGFIGAMSSRLIDRHHNYYVNQQLSRGGLLLWVSAATNALETQACRILQRHAARHVQVRDAAYVAPNFANAINLG